MEIALYIFLGLIGAIFLFYIIPTFLISIVLYTILLVRNKEEKWGRNVSWDNEEQQEMFRVGEEWGEENKEFQERVTIKSEGFNLVGEYFNFGFDKTVIIIAGRMESCLYCYYFAKPYKDSGYNILAIDNRSHGLSEGKYNTIGIKEYIDILNWSKFIHEKYGINNIVYHGICIGSATAIYAVTSELCPDYVKGLVTDGMYVNFSESLKNHLIERNKPLFPYVKEINMLISIHAGKNPEKFSPINVIDKLDKPILFIYSRMDTYSTPDKSEILYNKCSSKNKRIAWFDKGVHSHVRINNLEGYDNAVKGFLSDNFGD